MRGQLSLILRQCFFLYFFGETEKIENLWYTWVPLKSKTLLSIAGNMWNVKTVNSDLFKSSKNFRLSVRKLNKLHYFESFKLCEVPKSVPWYHDHDRNMIKCKPTSNEICDLPKTWFDSKMTLISKPSEVMRILEKMSDFFSATAFYHQRIQQTVCMDSVHEIAIVGSSESF